MNKEYMLSVIKECIECLEKEYRSYFSRDDRTENGSATMRYRMKRDLGIAKLIEYLLMYCPKTMVIDNAEVCAAFDRITERARRKQG